MTPLSIPVGRFAWLQVSIVNGRSRLSEDVLNRM